MQHSTNTRTHTHPEFSHRAADSGTLSAYNLQNKVKVGYLCCLQQGQVASTAQRRSRLFPKPRQHQHRHRRQEVNGRQHQRVSATLDQVHRPSPLELFLVVSFVAKQFLRYAIESVYSGQSDRFITKPIRLERRFYIYSMKISARGWNVPFVPSRDTAKTAKRPFRHT